MLPRVEGKVSQKAFGYVLSGSFLPCTQLSICRTKVMLEERCLWLSQWLKPGEWMLRPSRRAPSTPCRLLCPLELSWALLIILHLFSLATVCHSAKV